jgi:hypothetical protein
LDRRDGRADTDTQVAALVIAERYHSEIEAIYADVEAEDRAT